MKTRGCTLLELLLVLALIAVLAGLLLPATVRALRCAKGWVWGIESYHAARIDSVDDDKRFLRMMTNKPARWTFSDEIVLPAVLN